MDGLVVDGVPGALARPLENVMQRTGTAFTNVVATGFVRSDSFEPRFMCCTAEAGTSDQMRLLASGNGQSEVVSRVFGFAAALSTEQAMLVARAEALERYCAYACRPYPRFRAKGSELGEAALDLDLVARCSDQELATGRCPLVRPDKDAPIEWVSGVSLLDGRVTYIPAVLVYLRAARCGERFWLTNSTGCAAHDSFERAILSGILEVVERDAISVVWLQQLRLPRVDIDIVPSVLAPYWQCYLRSSIDLEYRFYDATLDLGFPTVYGVQIAHDDTRCRTLVSCSTTLDASASVAKVIRDMCSMRIAFRATREIPDSWDQFGGVFDGATYMARAEQARAFDFLLRSDRTILLSQMPRIVGRNTKEDLSFVLEVLRKKKLDVYAVDLSTDEAVRSGFRVVRVIIPGLQPLSFCYRARYLGHPRLYEASKAMGYPVLREEDLNAWPQPFA